MDFKKKFAAFLKTHQFLPISSLNKSWKSLKIVHSQSAPSQQEQKFIRLWLKGELNGHPGVYAYLNSRGSLLYVGKASNLYTRVYSHYRECFRGDGVWHKFFFKHAGKLTVLWREVQTDRQRRAIEEMIEEVQQSKFDEEYPRKNRK